jgi:hypothetical protein
MRTLSELLVPGCTRVCVCGSMHACTTAAPQLTVFAPVVRLLAQCYTFVVGKLSVEKLANFPEVDVFVRVACPHSTFVDSKVGLFQQAVLLWFVAAATYTASHF